MMPGHDMSPLGARFLRCLLTVRILALPVQLSVLVVLPELLHYPVNLTASVLVIGLYLAMTLHSWRHVQAQRPVTEETLFAQLLVDVVAMSALFFFAGGAANPFTMLLLLPITISAATLRPRATWFIVAISVLSYTLLMFLLNAGAHHHRASSLGINLHLWGMWLGFIVNGALVGYFVSRIGRILHEHDQALAQAREEALRSEHVLNLANLAAGAAHELGTPLATMAVLTTEMQEDCRDNPALAQRLAVLREQLDRCKETLACLALDAGQSRADAGHVTSLEKYIDALLLDWSEQRPEIRIASSFYGPLPAPRLLADRSLTQAIHNVLDNAADASPERVSFTARWSSSALTIRIQDSGAGIEPAVAERIGSEPVSTKRNKGGLGFGVLVSRSVLARLGGRLTYAKPDGEGTCATIELPLAALATD